MLSVKDLLILDPEFFGDYVTVRLQNKHKEAFAPDAITISIRVYTDTGGRGLCWEEQFEGALASVAQESIGAFQVHKVQAYCSCWPGQVTRVRVTISSPDGAVNRSYFPYLDGNPFEDECASPALRSSTDAMLMVEPAYRGVAPRSSFAMAPHNASGEPRQLLVRALALAASDQRICALPNYRELVATMAARGLRFGLPADVAVYPGIESVRLVSPEGPPPTASGNCTCARVSTQRVGPRTGMIPESEVRRYLAGPACRCDAGGDLVVTYKEELAPYQQGQVIVQVEHKPQLSLVPVVLLNVAVRDESNASSVRSTLVAFVPPYDPFA